MTNTTSNYHTGGYKRVFNSSSPAFRTSTHNKIHTMSETPESKPTIPASRRVFIITELLELILLEMSFIDLFILQRVDKQFRKTILDSPALQRKMLDPKDPDYETHDLLIPLDPFEFQPFGVCESSVLNWDRPAESVVSRADIRVLSFSFCEDDGSQIMGWQGKKAMHKHGSWEKLGWGSKFKRGNWRVRANAHSKRWRHAYTKISMEGTMGDLFAVLRKLRDRCARENAVVTDDPFWGFRDAGSVEVDGEMCEEARGD